MRTEPVTFAERARRRVQRQVQRMFPWLVFTRAETLAAMRHLQERLNEQKEETKQWRQRCLKVEEIYADQVRSMKEAVKDCELGWRIL